MTEPTQLTATQRALVKELWARGKGISFISCKLALIREYVQGYVRYLNRVNSW